MKNITVIGAGTMGNGIAHLFAMHNHTVSLVDVSDEALQKGLATITANLDRMVAKQTLSELQKQHTLQNLHTFTTIEAGTTNAELVVEAATENIDLKLKIFKEIDQHAPQNCILASNTSSISITTIAAATQRPQQVIGMHFMNPVPIMKLVEIINGYQTSTQTTSTIVEIAKKLDKIPVSVHDYPGFIANRILMPMINEAIISLFEGVAGVEEIDSIMKLGMAHPMGPLQLADFIGLDVCLAILQVLDKGFGNPKYAPCPLLVNMVAAKNLGIKSKIGFYDYKNGTKNATVASRFIN